MTLLAANGIKLNFGGVCALDDVSVSISRRGVHALIGPNGAGKTCLVNAITGAYRPSSGVVLLEGRDITGLAAYRLARLGVTRTFQNLQVLWTMTVLENVLCGFYLLMPGGFLRSLLRTPSLIRQASDCEKQALQLLRSVNLDRKAGAMAGDLSYGELKRLEIARALAGKPKLLFLDEPVAGCTATEKAHLGEAIRHIVDSCDTSIVLVEHDMKLVMSISDRITALVRGRIIAEGTPDVIRNDPAVIEAYLGKAASQDKTYAVAR